MNVKFKNVLLGLIVLLAIGLTSPFTLTAHAEEEEETLGEELQRDAKWLYDKGKESGKKLGSWIADKAPDVIDGIKETAPEIAEDIKETAPEVADKIKSGASQASEAINDYREGQQEEFMDWFENQTGTGDFVNSSKQISENTLATEDSIDNSVALEDETEEETIAVAETTDEVELVVAPVEEVLPAQADTDEDTADSDDVFSMPLGFYKPLTPEEGTAVAWLLLLLSAYFLVVFIFLFGLYSLGKLIYNRWFKKSK